MELKGWDQKRLAREMRVSRSAVNAWMNDRSYPRNAIARLEVVLGVSLEDSRDIEPADDRPQAVRDNWADPTVRHIWELTAITPSARAGLIEHYLEERDAGPAQESAEPNGAEKAG